MKKIIILLIGMILFTSTEYKAVTNDSSLTAIKVYNDVKDLYKEDVKQVIAYSVNKADSLVSKGYKVLSKGAAHTYDILIYQQKVKSLHHLFYFLMGITLTVVLFYRIKAFIKNQSDTNLGLLIVSAIAAIMLDIYNGANFNEMLTGFMNPEYGAIKEIIENLPN